MAVKTENRPVEVKTCDFCGHEVDVLVKCVICKREMCDDGSGKHRAYTLEVYAVKADNRICCAPVCDECAKKKIDITLNQLFDGMFGDSPVQTIDDSEE